MFVASLALTATVRAFAPRLRLLDRPNARSMHEHPTPRGGGLGIVVASVAAFAFAGATGSLSPRVALALAGGGVLVALLGLLDDRFTLSNRVRMPLWLAIAAVSVWLVGGLPTLDLGALVVPLGLVGGLLAVLGVVWCINLYNFMDGIDGIAGSQAVVAAGGGAALLWLAGDAPLALAAGALAAASLGFLAWNWPPARIFMGDVGSGFLGFAFAILALSSERDGSVPILVWGILLAPFLVDATFTVVRRVAAHEPFYEPHRTHVYQVAVRRGRSHRAVTVAFLAVDLALVPVTWAAWRFPTARAPLALLVLAVLGSVWWRLRPTQGETLK